MIKINLTGDKSSSDLSAHFQVAVFFLSLVSIIVICWTYTSFLDFNIAYIKQAELALREQLTELKKETRTVRDLEKKREVLKSKLGVIRELKARKIGPVKLLDDLGKSVPEKSWLLEIRDKGGVLRIDGLALDNVTIADFTKQLEKSIYFKRVDLLEVRQEEVRGVKMKRFSISAKISYSGATNENGAAPL
jgi:type IV pilus assembly protein PilN